MTRTLLNTDGLIGDLRRKYPAEHVLFLAFGPCVVRVAANRDAVADALAHYFKPFVVDARSQDIDISVHEAPCPDLPASFIQKALEPGKTKVKEAYADIENGRIVRKLLTGMVFIFNQHSHAAVGPCLDNLNQVVNFINNRFIQWRLCRGGLLGHAAGIAMAGRGLAMAGFSGAGKSTLALHLMSREATFVSNDRVMVARTDSGPEMWGVAKMPRINPGTALNNPRLASVVPPGERRRFAALPAGELWRLEHKYDAMIEDCFGPGRFHLTAPLHALAILNWKRGGGPVQWRQVDLAGREDLLPAFVKPVGLFFYTDEGCNATPADFDAYRRYLRSVTVLEFYGGVDFQAAADVCEKMLNQAGGDKLIG